MDASIRTETRFQSPRSIVGGEESGAPGRSLRNLRIPKDPFLYVLSYTRDRTCADVHLPMLRPVLDPHTRYRVNHSAPRIRDLAKPSRAAPRRESLASRFLHSFPLDGTRNFSDFRACHIFQMVLRFANDIPRNCTYIYI